MSPTAVFQAETIESLRRQLGDDGGDLLRELIRLYLDQARDLVAQIEAADATTDGQRLTSLTHKLKGSTATLGGDRLADVCRRLEAVPTTAGEIERADEIARTTRELRREFDELAHELDGYRRSLRRSPAARTE